MSLHSSYGPNPLRNLPLTDPKCKNDSCTAFQAAHNASQATVSYTRQFDYGHCTAWYFAIIILMFMIVHSSRNEGTRISRLNSGFLLPRRRRTKLIGAYRYLSYRRLRGPWVAFACLALSIAHTVPFLVAPLKDGGYAALHKQFYEPGGFEYTGTPALAILVGLAVFSIPAIRRRFYETFYFLHIALYISYLGLCFWHFGNLGDSWAYLWATLAIWLATVVFNRAFNVKGTWFNGSPVKLEGLSGGMTRLDVSAPAEFRWRPGQHCFLHMPGLELLGNHLFTIASAFNTFRIRGEEVDRKSKKLVSLFIRSHAGFTKKLATSVQNHAGTPPIAWLEGPYGGIPYQVEGSFDGLILVAGGAGVTACLPWLEHLMAQRTTHVAMRIRFIKFIWVVRHAEHLSWASGVVDAATRALRDDTHFLEACFYITGDNDMGENVPGDIEMGTLNTALPEGKTSSGQNDHVEGSAMAVPSPKIGDSTTGSRPFHGRRYLFSCS
ncbi:MAG: hypothetical protein Q9220_006404 [cf. Caloplaca sp. 1 TL-2023]